MHSEKRRIGSLKRKLRRKNGLKRKKGKIDDVRDLEGEGAASNNSPQSLPTQKNITQKRKVQNPMIIENVKIIC